MIVQRIQTDPKTLSQCTALMNICFPKAKIFNIQYMRWLYIDNPEGSVIGFNVWDRDQLVAHYACIPAQIQINSTPVKAMLSLNTATHPNYQGKGLFTKLANMTYETAYKEGFTAVFGVSNENSSYGFQKLGFQFLRPLEARLGLGSLHINHDVIQKNVQFQRIWSTESLDWRCSNPNNRVFRCHYKDKVLFHALALGKLPVYTEYLLQNFAETDQIEMDNTPFSLRLYLGIVPDGSCSFRRYYNIPHKLRPSPLNFIYRSLDGSVKQLDHRRIHFSFLDFDAY